MHAELQLLADQLAVDLDRSVLVEDSELRLLAASALIGVVDQSRRDSILMRHPTEGEKKLHRRYHIATTRDPVRLAADEQLGTLPRWCLPLRDQVLHGYLWLIDEPALTDEQLHGARTDVTVRVTRGSAVRGDTEGLTLGAGAPVASLAELGDQLGNARYAARVAAAAPEFGGAADWERLGGYALLQHFEHGPGGAERLCPGMTVLLDPRQAMYRDTVETYLASCGDTQATAQRLHIHRSTLYWRLNRVEQMLGRSLGDATVRVDLHLALRLARLTVR